MPYTIKDASGNTLYLDGAGTGADSGSAITPNSTILGATNETAPATDTAAAGLNGRLQRVAQRLTSLLALVPTSLTGGGNFKVAVQESIAVPVTDNSGSLTVDGTVTANQGGTWNIGSIASAVAVTDNNSTLSVDDGAGSLTVDGTVATTQSGTWNVGVSEKTMSIVTGTASTRGDNVLVAAPGVGVRIVVSSFVMQNESATATTMIMRDGTTSKFRVLGQAQGDGLVMQFPAGREWKLTSNTALNLNLSGANSCGYSVQYYTE